METEWMGRYRNLVAAIVRQTNCVVKDYTVRRDLGDGISLNKFEWQVLEYIVEHRYDDDRMKYISERLNIPQSSFSKIIMRLVDFELAEKYRMTNNKKNIIVKPTDKGIEFYTRISKDNVSSEFEGFFRALDSLDDHTIEQLTAAFDILAVTLEASYEKEEEKHELIKL